MHRIHAQLIFVMKFSVCLDTQIIATDKKIILLSKDFMQAMHTFASVYMHHGQLRIYVHDFMIYA